MSGYKIVENYRDNEELRNSFFKFSKSVFKSYDFKIWYDNGFWANEYVPHSIVKNGEIISNVSISTMKIYLKGEIKNGLQFATVGTLPEYRKQGLSKELISYVLEKYKNWTDIHFLFGNESVLNFYPIFGFRLNKESVFRNLTDMPRANNSARRLNIIDPNDYKIIKEKIYNRNPISKLFGADDYGFITHWHILNIFPDNIYYIEEADIIIISTEENGELNIWDIVFNDDFDLNNACGAVLKNNIKAVNYYFTPDIIKFHYDEIIDTADSPFFVKEDLGLNGIPFKFPATAQT